MKKEENTLYKFESLNDFHWVFGLQKPMHPLISFIDITDLEKLPNDFPKSMVMNFYKVSYKTGMCGQAKYGQHYYDFGEGGLVLTSPNQVFESPSGNHAGGSLLLVHPDFLLTYPLAKKIKEYGFFSYATNEALHLSENERKTILSIFEIIDAELKSRIDDFSQDVMIAQLELLLSYCNRFYKRQFMTRKVVNNELLQKMEEILDNYFNGSSPLKEGIPTVQLLSEELNISPSYLSDMLRALTGLSAQHHIHNKLVEKAKEMLSVSELTVSEIAYKLGFEYPQSFSRLFKSKNGVSPMAFRASFN
ncbi:AraC family transcriptional regulator [Flavivirga sp. 57AJ16]|uniref:helix-turn-helix domain-containing protein n=1 Tax=Flavivirga sp. 57AJ16 TaxID=3025307 RepID=UPI0023659453|nr:helix-turn-helix domain-containing protein [Flavivirga sp. 57AJ16]MDD7886765.1 AraC family transcriptional regulator [Flavivirga sp. 57AJ16]